MANQRNQAYVRIHLHYKATVLRVKDLVSYLNSPSCDWDGRPFVIHKLEGSRNFKEQLKALLNAKNDEHFPDYKKSDLIFKPDCNHDLINKHKDMKQPFKDMSFYNWLINTRFPEGGCTLMETIKEYFGSEAYVAIRNEAYPIIKACYNQASFVYYKGGKK